jgi:hypothetical protein
MGEIDVQKTLVVGSTALPLTETTSVPAPLPSQVFREHLPPGCPEEGTEPLSPQVVLRLVFSNPPVAEDFASYAATGRPCPPKVSGCRWASWSVFRGDTTGREAIISVAKLPRFKKRSKFLAHVNVPAGAGLGRIVQTGHIDFWMFSTFDPASAVLHLEALS